VLAVPKEIGYLCTVDLFDAKGVPVPKTTLGKKVGARFFDLPVDLKKLKTLNTESERGFNFYACSQLFNIKEPGKFSLRIQFQILSRDP